jgi:hypothetical protein
MTTGKLIYSADAVNRLKDYGAAGISMVQCFITGYKAIRCLYQKSN